MEEQKERLEKQNEAIEKASDGKKDEDAGKILFWTRVTGVSSLLAFLCILALTLSALSFMPKIGSLLSNFDEISAELKDMSTEITRVLRSLNEQGRSLRA